MNTRVAAALCSAVAPFAVAGGWLLGYALDDGHAPYLPAPVVAAVAPTTPPPVLLIETTAPATSAAHTVVRTVVREVPAPATTTAAAPALGVEPFVNCDEAYAAGRSNIPRGDPRYAEKLDNRGVEGVGCEDPPSSRTPPPRATSEETTAPPPIETPPPDVTPEPGAGVSDLS